MSTTISKITEQILLRLDKRTDDTDIDSRELALVVVQKLSSAILTRYFQGKQMDERMDLSGLVRSFTDVEVKKDAKSKQYYADLPANLIGLPNGEDVVDVIPGCDPTACGFTRTPLGFNSLYKGLMSAELPAPGGYYVENKRVYLTKIVGGAPDEVIIRMIAAYDGIDTDEEINIPSDIQDMTIEMVVQTYAPTAQAPDDTANDNVDQV